MTTYSNFQNQLLTLVKRPTSGTSLTLAEWSQIIFALRETSMLARFGYLAREAGCFSEYPAAVRRHIQSATMFAKRQQQQVLFEATDLYKQLNELGTCPIFLKGAAYSLLDNSAAQGRIYSDIDILVPKNSLVEIQKRLFVNGWMPKALDEYDDRYYREWTHELPPMYHTLRGSVADIHHNLIPPISGKAPDILHFTQNTQKTDNGLRTLAQEGLILHSCIHLFYNEEFSHGFRDIFDLHLLFSELKDSDLCWQRLIALAIKTDFTHVLYYAYRYCRKLFETKFPDCFKEKIETLRPNNASLYLTDAIIGQALLPKHKNSLSFKRQCIDVAALVRGHWLKMPLKTLVPHLAYKSWKGLRDGVAGKYTFERADP